MHSTSGIFNYDIIGELRVSSDDDGNLSYTGPADDFFTVEYTMPFNIRTGRHAVLVKRVRPTGRVFGTYIAIIDRVMKYGYDTESKTLTLEFHATPIPTTAISGELTAIHPQIVNMLQRDTYLAMLYRGDVHAIADHIRDNMRLFYHGGKIYKTYGASVLREPLSDDTSIDVPRIETGVVVLACADTIPDMEDFYNFHCQFSHLIGIDPGTFDEFMKKE